jgi:hypothetical protein
MTRAVNTNMARTAIAVKQMHRLFVIAFALCDCTCFGDLQSSVTLSITSTSNAKAANGKH